MNELNGLIRSISNKLAKFFLTFADAMGQNGEPVYLI